MARIVIVGGGIGGLCAARAVALAGHDALVLERATESAAIGAGLLLWPNAVRALDALGCGDAVRAASAVARRTVITTAAGRPLFELDVEALGRRAGAPMIVIERPALLACLAGAATEAGVSTRYDARVVSVSAAGAVLDGGERVPADAVIGADGIGSVVREYVSPGTRPIDTGYTVVRGLADHQLPDGQAFEAWGRAELVGGVGLPAGRSYWFYESRSNTIDADDPLAAVTRTRWPEPLPAQISATPRERLLVNPILRLTPLRTWTRGAVALVGDAAHAMEPNLGQGAAQTIEDAESLLANLRGRTDLPAAFAAYAAERQARAHMLQREATRFARMALLPFAAPRDVITRFTPAAVRIAVLERHLRHHAPARLVAARG